MPRRSRTLLLGYQVTPFCDRLPVLQESRPERHWAMLETISRELIVLNDYEPATEHFPVQYREQRFSSIAHEFDFTAARKAAWVQAFDSAEAGTFVVSWGVPSGGTDCGAWVEPPLQADLRRHYALRYQSEGNSRVQVWERREQMQ